MFRELPVSNTTGPVGSENVIVPVVEEASRFREHDGGSARAPGDPAAAAVREGADAAPGQVRRAA